MKAIVLNLSAWVMLPFMDAIAKYLSAEMYSPKKVVDSISSMIVVSTLMSLITVPIIVFISLKYFPY